MNPIGGFLPPPSLMGLGKVESYRGLLGSIRSYMVDLLRPIFVSSCLRLSIEGVDCSESAMLAPKGLIRIATEHGIDAKYK